MWSVFEKVAQSNSRFNATDTLIVDVHSVGMPAGFGRNKKALKARGRPLANLAHLKRSIVRVSAEKDCLAHALIIAIAKLKGDANYTAYRQGRKIGPQVRRLLEATGKKSGRWGRDPRTQAIPRASQGIQDSRLRRSRLSGYNVRWRRAVRRENKSPV